MHYVNSVRAIYGNKNYHNNNHERNTKALWNGQLIFFLHSVFCVGYIKHGNVCQYKVAPTLLINKLSTMQVKINLGKQIDNTAAIYFNSGEQ